MKEIEQNNDGNIFAVPYLDNGNFYVRIFTVPEAMADAEFLNRTDEMIKDNELDVN
jgi:hypothetical protein